MDSIVPEQGDSYGLENCCSKNRLDLGRGVKKIGSIPADSPFCTFFQGVILTSFHPACVNNPNPSLQGFFFSQHVVALLAPVWDEKKQLATTKGTLPIRITSTKKSPKRKCTFFYGPKSTTPISTRYPISPHPCEVSGGTVFVSTTVSREPVNRPRWQAS